MSSSFSVQFNLEKKPVGGPVFTGQMNGHGVIMILADSQVRL